MGGRPGMALLQHECGIAAVYHLDAPRPSPLAPRLIRHRFRVWSRAILLDLQTEDNWPRASPHTTGPRADPRHLQTTRNSDGGIRLNRANKAADILNEFSAQLQSVTFAMPPAVQTTKTTLSLLNATLVQVEVVFIAFNGQLANVKELRDELLATAIIT